MFGTSAFGLRRGAAEATLAMPGYVQAWGGVPWGVLKPSDSLNRSSPIKSRKGNVAGILLVKRRDRCLAEQEL